jgi:hypothetical protein
LLVVLLALPAMAQHVPKSDWETQYERQLQEQQLEQEGLKMLPAYPKQENLIEFYVAPTTDFKFFVDAASLTVEGEVMRYTVVARSPSGVDNVSYEGLRCGSGQYRTYAVGHRDGTWAGRITPWRPYPRRAPTAWQHVLASQYFCAHNEPIRSVDEGVSALRGGGHPSQYRRCTPYGGYSGNC